MARSLEQRWEEALRDQRQVEEDRDRCLRGQPPRLTADERARITALASDVPLLWRDVGTTAADRQAVIRHLVERVVVTVQAQTEYANVRIHWAGGYVSEHEVTRPVRRYDQLRDIDRLVGRIVELREAERGATEIAEHLNREGFRPPKGRATFTAAMVRQILSRRGLSAQNRGGKAAGEQLGPHEWWLGDLARELRVPYSTLNHWRSRGWLHCRRLPGVQGRWIMWADGEELGRLRRLRGHPRAWSDDPYPPELTTPKKRTDA